MVPLLTSAELTGLGLSHVLTYDAAESGELTQVTFPYGGHLRWHYRNFTYNGRRTLREVDTRYLCKDAGCASVLETTYTLYRDDPNDGPRTVHGGLALIGPEGIGSKFWAFISAGPRVADWVVEVFAGRSGGRSRP